MAAVGFPNSLSVGDEFTANNKVWRWDGTVWDGVPTVVSATIDGGDPQTTFSLGNELNGGDPGSF